MEIYVIDQPPVADSPTASLATDKVGRASDKAVLNTDTPNKTASTIDPRLYGIIPDVPSSSPTAATMADQPALNLRVPKGTPSLFNDIPRQKGILTGAFEPQANPVGISISLTGGSNFAPLPGPISVDQITPLPEKSAATLVRQNLLEPRIPPETRMKTLSAAYADSRTDGEVIRRGSPGRFAGAVLQTILRKDFPLAAADHPPGATTSTSDPKKSGFNLRLSSRVNLTWGKNF